MNIDHPLSPGPESPPDLPTVPWTIKDIWIGLALFLAWLLISIGFGVARVRYSWNFDLGLFLVLWELVLIIPAWWLTLHRYKLKWEALGIRKFDPVSLAIGCGLMVFTYLFNFLYNMALLYQGIQSDFEITDIFEMGSSPWLIFLAGIVIAPFVEEIFFRGFIFTGLRDKYGWIPAALISSALFAAVHLQPLTMPPIFLMGLVFAYLYQRTESIWPAVIMHFSTNTLGLAAAYLISRLGTKF